MNALIHLFIVLLFGWHTGTYTRHIDTAGYTSWTLQTACQSRNRNDSVYISLLIGRKYVETFQQTCDGTVTTQTFGANVISERVTILVEGKRGDDTMLYAFPGA